MKVGACIMSKLIAFIGTSMLPGWLQGYARSNLISVTENCSHGSASDCAEVYLAKKKHANEDYKRNSTSVQRFRTSISSSNGLRLKKAPGLLKNRNKEMK